MTLRLTPIRQPVARDRLADVDGALRDGFGALDLANRLRRGDRVAIAVGSRGIAGLRQIVRTTIDLLVANGARPFLVPAMGSHGGGTAEGQRAVLDGYGLAPESTGVPLISQMETVRIGETPDGMPVYLDREASRADGIIAINRIKAHTAFDGRWESGLMKILSVGLGKARGAETIHNHGLPTAMPAAARVVISEAPVLAGIGVVENGEHEPARIAVLPADRIEAEEPKLLEEAYRLMPRIPLEPLDLLVVREMGKDISGTGMDLNVIGMWRRVGGPVQPRFETIAVLDLTPNSHGNAIGVGHADLIPRRLRDKIEPASTYTNCLTSHNLAGGKIPITLPTDRDVIDAGLRGRSGDEARVLLIRNTLDLEDLWVSDALLAEVEAAPELAVTGVTRPLEFSDTGDLLWEAL